MLMKFTDVLPIIEKQMNLRLEKYCDSHTLSSKMLMLFKNNRKDFDPKSLQDQRYKMIQNIQAARCQLFTYLGDHEFISHQTSLFVYHQLKNYADLLTLANSDTFNLPLGKIIQKDLSSLEQEFDKWKPYAEKFELPFRRGQ